MHERRCESSVLHGCFLFVNPPGARFATSTSSTTRATFPSTSISVRIWLALIFFSVFVDDRVLRGESTTAEEVIVVIRINFTDCCGCLRSDKVIGLETLDALSLEVGKLVVVKQKRNNFAWLGDVLELFVSNNDVLYLTSIVSADGRNADRS